MTENDYTYDEITVTIALDPDRDPDFDEEIYDYIFSIMDKLCRGKHHWWQFWRKPGCAPIDGMSTRMEKGLTFSD